MPRVTRRSLAAKDESPAPEPAKSGRSKRGSKKEEAEDVPIGEPQELPPPKKGRQAPAEASTPARGRSAAKGRSSSRAKKEEPEPEEEEEQEEEEVEKTPQKGRAASRGKGKGARGRGGRSTSRATKGKAAEVEDDEEVEDETEAVSEEQESTPSRGRGRAKQGKSSAAVKEDTPEIGQGEAKSSDADIVPEKVEEEEEEEKIVEEQTEEEPKAKSGRSRGKQSVTPSPKGGKRGRGKSTAAEEESEEKEELDTTTEASPSGRRGGRGQRSADTTPKQPTPPSRSRRGRASAAAEELEVAGDTESSDAVDSTKLDQSGKAQADEEQQVKSSEESMETEESTQQAIKDSQSKDEEMVCETKNENITKEATIADNVPKETHTVDQEKKKEMPQASESKTAGKGSSPAKKRKLDEEDEIEVDSKSKRQRTSESAADAADDLQDFVVVNKDEVPPPDSKEVIESVPKATPVKEVVQEEIPDQTEEESSMPAPPVDGTNVVPLTEAELAKRYTNIHREREREENSSIIVEIGSEPASDVTSISARLDVSDAVSMDSSVMDQPQESSSSDGFVTDQQKDQDAAPVEEIAAALPTPKEESSSLSSPMETEPTEVKPVEEKAVAPPPTKNSLSTPMETEPAASCEAKEPTEVKPVSHPPAQHNTVPVQSDISAPEKVSNNVSVPLEVNSLTSPKTVEPQNIPANSSSAEQSLSSSQEQSKTVISSSLSHSEPVVNDNQQEKQVSSIPMPPSVPSVQTPPKTGSNALGQQPAPASQLSSPTGKHNGVEKPEIKSLPSPVKTPVLSSSEKYVPSSPAIDKRKFILNPNFPAELMDPAFCFSVVTYNILADCHLRRWDYSFTEPQYLDQMYRHNLMMKELAYLDGDIVCMQEVSPVYYKDTLCPAMASRGYEGHFLKRTKDYYDEGEATFIKTSKFDVISSDGISLKDLAFKEVASAGLSEEVSRAARKHLDRADVILLSKLTCKKTGKTVTVCNIHVVYDPSAPDVQCVQVASAIKELVAKAGNDLNPHIICGDFNSEVRSPGYQLARDGYLSEVHIHKLQALKSMDNTDGSSQSVVNHMWKAFQHTSAHLKSAYETTVGKEPAVTSYNKLTYSTLDYIWHSGSTLDTVGVLESLDKHVVDATGGLPSVAVPSDHLSLKAVFRIK